MIHVADLEIDRAAVESFPESLARENCVLPLGYKDQKLQLLFGRRESYQEDIEKFVFLMKARIDCFVAEHSRVEQAIDEVDRLISTRIENCRLEVQFACLKTWLELQPTTSDLVRSCDICHQDIVFCSTPTEAIQQALAGHRIALYEPHPDETETVECFVSYY